MNSLMPLLKAIPQRGWAGLLTAVGALVMFAGGGMLGVEFLALLGLVMAASGVIWLASTARSSNGKRRTAIPLAVQRQVWTRANDRCEIPRCDKVGRLEFHHIDNDPAHHAPENVIHLCHSHHDLATRGRYTRDALRDYIEESRQRERNRRRGSTRTARR